MKSLATLGAMVLLLTLVGCSSGESHRISKLESQVSALRSEVNSLKAAKAGTEDSGQLGAGSTLSPDEAERTKAPANGGEVKYVGSINSNKFHYPWCTAANRIKPENLVTFKTREEATAAGRVPCRICNP